MKNKKGFFLAEETLKIVLAIIVIIFLVYLLVSLYFSNKEAQEIGFAEASLKNLVEQLNSKNSEIQIFNPDGWRITSWTAGGAGMPLTCSNLGWKNCLCICDTTLNPFDSVLDECNKLSSCLEYDNEIFIKQGTLEIENPPITFEINYGGKIEISKK